MKILIETKRFGVKEVLFDAKDFDIVKKYTWRIQYDKGNFYARCFIKINGVFVSKKMHRMILGISNSDKPHVDHKNHDGLDNRRRNIRVATIAENTRNFGINSRSTTGYKGVYLYKSPNPNAGKYTAATRFNGQRIHGGYFKTAIEAAKKYNEMALKYHGEFAYLNEIPK